MGATRVQIATQYIFESGLLVTAATVVAVLLLLPISPILESAADIRLFHTVLTRPKFYVSLLVLLAGVTLAAGAYPAMILSGAQPMDALRVGHRRSGPRFVSTLLVGVQFVAASFLLIAVIVMYSQDFELRRSGIGSYSDPLLVIDNASGLTGVDDETLRNLLLSNSAGHCRDCRWPTTMEWIRGHPRKHRAIAGRQCLCAHGFF